MFLLAITKEEISQNFKSMKVEELNIQSLKATVIIDKFLSEYISEPDGFTILESPLIPSVNFRDIILSQITYHKNKETLTIDRPFISGRPIYYHINHRGEFFCSTHLSMLRTAGVPIIENTSALPEFFIYRYVMPPQTLYKDINQLTTGRKLLIKLISGKWKIVKEIQYNPFSTTNQEVNSIDTIVKDAINLLEDPLKKLQSNKERIAVLFSGGLDSSILFKICQRNNNINTSYSTGYPFENLKKNIEREYAQTAADVFHITNNYYSGSTNEYQQAIIEGISKAEEPLGHLQSAMLYLLFKKGIPKDKDIIISGYGADGIFGDAQQYYLFHSEKINQILKLQFFYQKIKNASIKTGMELPLINKIEKKIFPIRTSDNVIQLIDSHGDADWSSNYFNVRKEEIIQGHWNIMKEFKNRSLYDIISVSYLFGDDSITQSNWSKLGESQRKILFYPYTYALNYAYSLSWDKKLKKPKNILRQVARQLDIPNFIVTRPKSGFVISGKFWAEKGGALEPLVSPASKIIDKKQMYKMQSSDPTKAWTFWNMLNYSLWKRLCINNEPPEILVEELN
jgi:asparagine synthetase B (glutamine-hydrolysing)